MSLLSAIQNRTPLVWVMTTEPERLIANIPAISDDRIIYIFDPIKGLLQWSSDDNEWKIVLVNIPSLDPDEEDDQVTLSDYPSALSYVLSSVNSIFIARNAHKDIDNFLSLYSSIYGQYRNAFWTNNLDSLPVQIIALSAGDSPPAEIANMCTKVSYGTPSDNEFASIVSHINEHHEHDILKGQDLQKIVNASRGMTEFEAIETYFQSIRTNQVIDQEMISKLKLDRLKRETILDIIRPTVDLANVGGLDNAKHLISQADWIWRNPNDANEFGLTALRRVLFLGLPGTGKSYICEAAAKTLGLDLARTGIGKIMNKFVGQSEQNMLATFQHIAALAPIAVWIDELGRDLSGGGSSDTVDGGTTSRVHAAFLTGLQELPDNVFLFAAANDIDSLAPEMLRADRFDKIMFVGFPSFKERREIFRLNLSPQVQYDLDHLAEATPCFTGAEIKSLVKEVRFKVSPSEKRHINTDDIIKAVPLQKNRLWLRHRHTVTSMYSRALVEHEWASTDQFNDAALIVKGKEPSKIQVKTSFNLK
jgi:hypothetical protein